MARSIGARRPATSVVLVVGAGQLPTVWFAPRHEVAAAPVSLVRHHGGRRLQERFDARLVKRPQVVGASLNRVCDEQHRADPIGDDLEVEAGPLMLARAQFSVSAQDQTGASMPSSSTVAPLT